MSMSDPLCYCDDLLRYSRWETREVMVGDVGIGGANPIRVQSMITSDTRDTAACVAEVLGLADAGCEIVRITAQTKAVAANLEQITKGVRAAGCGVPLVADIHFKPDAAMEAARWVEKVRVNPGNYVDKKKFEIREYSDAQYDEELERIRAEFTPLVERCRELGRAMRIGTNHGSLSDRIMNRYGDTPLGMVESALEFARIAREHDYHALVFSMKASNPKVMIEAYRLLVARLREAGPDWNYPVHLGVTEAGDGEDGRIKSAVGIGSLLADGIGDTIRVSLTEDAVHEVPVAEAIVRGYNEKRGWSVPLQTVGGASRPLIGEDARTVSPDWDKLEKRTSTYLPHWKIDGAVYAVTFRLGDSLPDDVFRDYQRQRTILGEKFEAVKKQAGSRNCEGELSKLKDEMAALHDAVLDAALNKGEGACQLANEEVAKLVLGGLRHFDGERYQLIAWSVMPNHVHVVVRPFEGFELREILHTWKSFTAKKVNALLGLAGGFWQEESYDHLVRDGGDFRSQVKYVLMNPVKAGVDAQWTGSIYGDCWAEVSGAGRSGNELERDAPATGGCGEGGVSGAGRSGNDLERDAPATGGCGGFEAPYDPFSYERRRSSVVDAGCCGVGGVGGSEVVRVFATRACHELLGGKLGKLGDFEPEGVYDELGVVELDPEDPAAVEAVNVREDACLVSVADGVGMEVIPAFRLLAARVDARHPVVLKDVLGEPDAGGGGNAGDALDALLVAAGNIGSLLCDGIGDSILVRGERAPGASLRLAFNILQAAGTRIFKTDYVACPSCGRTLFNLQETTQRIRAATGHLKGVRIAVMGCIVNGPGEMADADFGYVGGAPGKINLYVGKEAVEFNIPTDEAVDRLIGLIKDHGRWVDAPEPVSNDV